MGNTAALFQSLTFSGSMLSTGLPNATGTVNFYVPGGLVPQAVYSDPAGTIAVTQPVTLDNGGRIPVANYANGIYTTVPVRVIVKDVNGNIVSDATLVSSSAGAVGLANADWPNEATEDAAWTALGRSLGTSAAHGQDGKVVVGSGATARYIRDKFVELAVSVKDFGAAGDGLTDDTTACQAALTYIGSLGSGTLKFPAGTYKISASALTLPSSKTGISIVGDGSGASIINQTTAATDTFDATLATSLVLRGIGFNNGTVTLATCNGVVIDNCSFNNVSVATGLTLNACGQVYIINGGVFGGTTALSVAGGITLFTAYNCIIGSNGTQNVLMAGTSSGVVFNTCDFSGGATAGIKYAAAASGNLTVTDSPSLANHTTPVDVSALSNDPGIVLRNCGMDFTLQDNLVADAGHTATPNPLYGITEMRVTSASGGASITLGTPSPSPVSGQLKGRIFRTYFVNASGSGVTWVFPAGAGQYLTATTVPTANGTKFTMAWMWDGSNWNFIGSGQAT